MSHLLTLFYLTRHRLRNISYILYIYNKAFGTLRMGYGSALAWILTLIILAVTLLVFRSSPHWVYYEAERRKEEA